MDGWVQECSVYDLNMASKDNGILMDRFMLSIHTSEQNDWKEDV